MSRHYGDWLTAFLRYCEGGEAPRHVNFWTGVSTIAGVLRRRVWIDMKKFKWYPNFYVILVAPPGIISKSTTTALGMKLLKQVPGVYFGPHVVTWEALVTRFARAAESFEHQGRTYTMSPLTLDSGEFGNLFDPHDRKMVDIFVRLWDCPDGKFEKETKMAGCDTVIDPFINLIACTTPSWIAGSFPEYLIGGGFTSRCIFVYAEEKEQFAAYPDELVIEDYEQTELKLIQDLEHIGMTLTGPYSIAKDARDWGRQWYENHYKVFAKEMDKSLFGGYIARKQTHLHKLAIILAASCSDEMVITFENLQTAEQMLSDLEPDMNKVFSKIGRSQDSLNADKLLEFVRGRGSVSYIEAYRRVHMYFPSSRVFEEVVKGAVQSGQIAMRDEAGKGMMLYWVTRT